MIPQYTRYSNKAFGKVIYTFIFAVIFSLVYIFIESILKIDFNIINLIIVFSCLWIIGVAYYDMRNMGITLKNVFQMTYFGILLFNNFNLSDLQRDKTIIDYYYFFVGPLFFCFFLNFAEAGKKIKLVKLKCLKSDTISLIIIISLIISKGFIFYRTGIRWTSDLWSTEDIKHFTISGLSGISNLFMWMSLMMFPSTRKKWLKALCIFIPIFCSVFSANRGDFMRIAIFIVFCWMKSYESKVFTSKNIVKLIIVAIIALILFSLWGSYRQQKRGWSSATTIGSLMGSKIDNEVLNWTYIYTAINFDVLKQEFIEQEKTGEFKALFVPIIRIIEGSDGVEKYIDSFKTNGLNGFNASTFLAYFIRESGEFYFIALIFLGMFVAILDFLCKFVGFKGGQVFLLMMISLTMFGNYILNVNMLFALIFGILLFTFVNVD